MTPPSLVVCVFSPTMASLNWVKTKFFVTCGLGIEIQFILDERKRRGLKHLEDFKITSRVELCSYIDWVAIMISCASDFINRYSWVYWNRSFLKQIDGDFCFLPLTWYRSKSLYTLGFYNPYTIECFAGLRILLDDCLPSVTIDWVHGFGIS